MYTPPKTYHKIPKKLYDGSHTFHGSWNYHFPVLVPAFLQGVPENLTNCKTVNLQVDLLRKKTGTHGFLSMNRTGDICKTIQNNKKGPA